MANVNHQQDAVAVANRSARPVHQPTEARHKVAILLCTYHGQQYLADQLESFAAQTYADWQVWASDDGSRDNTRTILESYQLQWGADRLSIHSGPEEGFVANFLSLTCNANIKADYYAYSDQDDIWEVDKLQRAIDWLVTCSENIPAMYCTRTRLVNAKNQDIGFSPLFANPTSFANALVQNIAGGNTMVFNQAARDLLFMAGDSVRVAAHDWWAYIVITGCGGRVYYDRRPSLRYRQHDENLIGIGSGWPARLLRAHKVWQGRFREWADQNIQALLPLRSQLTPENRKLFDQFSVARNQKLLPRLIGLARCGVYRQSVWSNLGFIAAVIFKKI